VNGFDANGSSRAGDLYDAPLPEGDSISIGYAEYVRCALEGLATVIRLHKNAGNTSNSFCHITGIKTGSKKSI